MSDLVLPAARERSASPALLLLRRLVRRRLVLISLFVLLVMVVAAVGAPWLAPYAPRKMDIAHRLSAPSAAHWFGTDEFGRDVLTRCIYGARLSLTVGLFVVLLSLVCGTILGVVAGYIRRLDGLLMRVTDALMALGIEIEDPEGSEYRDGMTLHVAVFDKSDRLETGQRMVSETLSPTIYFKNKLANTARVIVSVGTKDGLHGT